MADHYIDEEKMKASVYMEFCDAGDLEKVVINQRQVSGGCTSCMGDTH
jgi:hypothetical protein